MNEPGRPVDVTVLHTEGCASTPPTIDLVREVARGMDVCIHLLTVLVQSPRQATELRFLGSPTVQVDGLDVDPATRTRHEYGLM
jgi:hypothetical protein